MPLKTIFTDLAYGFTAFFGMILSNILTNENLTVATAVAALLLVISRLIESWVGIIKKIKKDG